MKNHVNIINKCIFAQLGIFTQLGILHFGNISF
jgi:hypothetical protein